MFNIRLLAKYLWHRMVANNRHGLHSPFVYRLVDTVIYDFYAKKVYAELKSVYTTFRNDHSFTTPPFKVWQLLYRLVADARPSNYILAGEHSYVWQPMVRLAAPAALSQDLSSTKAAAADLIVLAPAANDLLQLLEQCLPHIYAGTTLVIAGLYRHRYGKAAWRELQQQPSVTVTIDLFWLQLVYFKTGQVKEHFRVKY